MPLSDNDKLELLRLARDAMECAVRGQKMKEPSVRSPELTRPCGAFVTLTEHGQLRGCIGYTEATMPLSEVVQEVAVKAALDDPRFPPVTVDELEEIELEISVISPMEKVSDIEKIEVGKHGLFLENGYFRGLLLPQVAVEYKWDRKAFLENTARKAGLHPDAWKDRNTVIYTFTAEVFGEKQFAHGA